MYISRNLVNEGARNKYGTCTCIALSLGRVIDAKNNKYLRFPFYDNIFMGQ